MARLRNHQMDVIVPEIVCYYLPGSDLPPRLLAGRTRRRPSVRSMKPSLVPAFSATFDSHPRAILTRRIGKVLPCVPSASWTFH